MGHTAKIFMNGKSQAVRLPKEFRFKGKEVDIRRDPKTGDVVLSEVDKGWGDFFEQMKKFNVPKDFMDDRVDPPPQKRDWMYDDS
jgi:antitoxin VapB